MTLFAAVNVNFYITPDEASLDLESGGMAVWNATIDTEPLMRQLNGSEQAIKAYLASRKAGVFRGASNSTARMIVKNPRMTVWLSSRMFPPWSRSAPVTACTMPTRSADVTVTI